MRNKSKTPKMRRRGLRRLFWVGLGLVVLAVAAIIVVRRVYYDNLQPVSDSNRAVVFTITSGESSKQIGTELQQKGLVKSSTVFQWYISSQGVRGDLQAGTYVLEPNMGVAKIVQTVVQGKVATNLLTILPGERLDQVRTTFIKAGFSAAAVDSALEPGQYAELPALVGNPSGASLEGFLYPDSFQKSDTTPPQVIVQESLDEMGQHLSPSIRAAFAREGLTAYQGVTLASIVEQEVANQSDRAQAAQVFLKRLKVDMALGSDVTAYYGAIIAGHKPSTTFDSAYNTLQHKGLPPGPISMVSGSSLNAVAYPANTDWLYFVSGDNGKTYFSKTLQQQQAYTQQYCHKLCSGTQ